MPRYFPGTTIALRQAVRVGDVLTDAAEITFKWRMGPSGEVATITPTRISEGQYEAQLTPTIGGDLYYRWDTEGDLDVAQEGVLNIAPTQFAPL